MFLIRQLERNYYFPLIKRIHGCYKMVGEQKIEQSGFVQWRFRWASEPSLLAAIWSFIRHPRRG